MKKINNVYALLIIISLFFFICSTEKMLNHVGDVDLFCKLYEMGERGWKKCVKLTHFFVLDNQKKNLQQAFFALKYWGNQ